MASIAGSRPDPDALLRRVQREEAQAKRGKLKIFFGACAGVGKTYQMLSSAREEHSGGTDVVLGVLETHGRSDTAALAEGFERIAPREVYHKGAILKEFDIDAAIARRPGLIIVDELAHSNAPGSRHPKRWQDIEELLLEGIDVYSTLNVQHLDSLNDVVGQITGVRVWETLPDKVFEQADEVELVDLPPDDLRELKLRRPALRIMLLAGRAGARANALGEAFPVIRKPFSIEALVGALEAEIGKRHSVSGIASSALAG